MEMKNTFTAIELSDGETVEATLTYYHLLKLKGADPDLFARYNDVIMHGAADEFGIICVLYTAYLCAQIATGTEDDAMGEDEFLMRLRPDRKYTTDLFLKLTNPKKAEASASRS